MTLQKFTEKNQHNPSIKLGRGSYTKATKMPSALQPVPRQNSFPNVAGVIVFTAGLFYGGFWLLLNVVCSVGK